MKKITTNCFVLLLGVALAPAQMEMTNRLSEADYSYLYGYAADVRSGDDEKSDNLLLTSSSFELLGHSDGSGYYPPTDHQWSVAVDAEMENYYELTGTVASASKIHAMGSVNSKSVNSGATSSIGGHESLELRFQLAKSQEFRFWGSLEQDGPLNRNNSAIYMYKHDGNGFVLIKIKLTDSSFDEKFTLAPGLYKMLGESGSISDGNEERYANWAYSLEAVPEPATMAVMLSGLALLAHRRRKA